jgi:hypothetical protein
MMTDDDAVYYAENMSTLQRAVLLLCSPDESFGYSRLAEKTGSTYAEVSVVGNHLQAANLATVSPVREGREFAGSAIYKRGQQVRAALERLNERKS